MPRYAPLPRVELDPRAEAELVKAAARRVYEASSATINDFSSGSPIMALLEGQAFAQSEFLQFANQFPESVLVEWIGPFLGAQRRTGSGAIVDVTFQIQPSDQVFQIFEGFQLGTDPRMTGGNIVKFVTVERLSIPKGEIEGTVRCISLEMGTKGNVPPLSIVNSLTSLAGVKRVYNLLPATGGLDPELMSEVKERFFSLIRRRNPVSSEDWVDWFTDALGPGTAVKVLPRHSERDTYSYESNYISTNPSVAFYVLNPDGTPISNAQRGALENLMKWSLPIEFMGYTYPMEVGEMDIVLDLKYDPTKPYSQNRADLSRGIRNTLFSILTPNAVFPIDYNQTATDIESALTSSFPVTLGVTNRFTDPDVQELYGYHTPVNAAINTLINTTPIPYEPGPRIREGDLVLEAIPTGYQYFEVYSDFDPIPNDKAYHVNMGNLELTHLRELAPGDYNTGDIIATKSDRELMVVLNPFSYDSRVSNEELVAKGFLSEPKDYSAFAGDLSHESSGIGKFDPDLIQFVQADLEGVTHIPSEPQTTLPQYRPGYPVFVAKRYFSVGEPSITLGQAQTNGLISEEAVFVPILQDTQSYKAGSYVQTPDPNKIVDSEIHQDSCYISRLEGASIVYLRIQEDITFTVGEGQTYTSAVQSLMEFGPVKQVDPISFVNCAGFPIFANSPFRHEARFRVGEYVRYRSQGGFDSSELEDCFLTMEKAGCVSGECEELMGQQLPLPRYYQVLVDFTPETTDPDEMVRRGLIAEVSQSVFAATYYLALDDLTQTYSFNITKALIESGQIQSVDELENAENCYVTNMAGRARGLYEWKGGQWVRTQPSLPTFRDLFRFAPGDVAGFRQGSKTRSYTAQSHVTPLFDPSVYVKSGVFTQADDLSSTVILWYDPEYHLETVCYHKSEFGAYSFYRATRSDNPSSELVTWNNAAAAATPRLSELHGKLLKIVTRVGCNEEFLPRLLDGASALKLGTLTLKLTSKDSLQTGEDYVVESADYADEVPEFSESPNVLWDKSRIDYGDGTLSL